LKYIDNPDAIGSLEILLDDPEEIVINATINSLTSYSEFLPEKIIHKFIQRWYSANATDTLRTMLNCFGDLRKAITIRPIINKYDELPESLKSDAIETLGRMNDKKVHEFVLSKLEEENYEIRLALIRAIGDLKIISASMFLLDNIEGETDDETLISLFYSIGRLKLDTAVDKIKYYCDLDQSNEVRISCIDALGEIGTDEVVPILETYLDDEYDQVPSHIVEAAGKIYSLQSYSFLMEKVVNGDTDIEEDLKQRAQELADNIKFSIMNKEAHYELVENLSSDDYYVRIKASRKILKLPNPPVNELISALESNNVHKASYAAEILGILKEFNAIPALKRVYKNNSGEVRAFTGWALSQMKVLN
jgi:HEAT repeat protein